MDNRQEELDIFFITPDFLDELSEFLATRRDLLSYTNYELAKRYAELKSNDIRNSGHNMPANYTSTVTRIMKFPKNTKFENLDYIVRILGGSLAIVWID